MPDHDTDPDSDYDTGEPTTDQATKVTFSGASDDRLYLGGDYNAEAIDWRPDGEFRFDNGLVVEVTGTDAQQMCPTDVPDDCDVSVENYHSPFTATRTVVTSERHIGDWEYVPADEEVSD